MNVQIVAEIQECYFQEAKFETYQILESFELGLEQKQIPLPQIISTTSCDFPIELVHYEMKSEHLPPNARIEDMFDFNLDETTLTVKNQTDFSFLNQTAQIKVTVITSEDLRLSASITVEYVGNGTWFESENLDVPDITCSEADRDWSFTLPEIAYADE